MPVGGMRGKADAYCHTLQKQLRGQERQLSNGRLILQRCRWHSQVVACGDGILSRVGRVAALARLRGQRVIGEVVVPNEALEARLVHYIGSVTAEDVGTGGVVPAEPRPVPADERGRWARRMRGKVASVMPAQGCSPLVTVAERCRKSAWLTGRGDDSARRDDDSVGQR